MENPGRSNVSDAVVKPSIDEQRANKHPDGAWSGFERAGIAVAVASGLVALTAALSAMIIGADDSAGVWLPTGVEGIEIAVALGVGAMAVAFYALQLADYRSMDIEIADTSREIDATIREIRERQASMGPHVDAERIERIVKEGERRVREAEKLALEHIETAAKSAS